MSCRNRKSSSAATSLARLDSGITDQQVMSLYHALRDETPDNAPVPTTTEWRDYINKARRRALRDPDLTDRRKMSINDRLDLAALEPSPDPAEWHALRNISRRANTARLALDREHTQLAQRLALPVERVRDLAAEYADEARTQLAGRRRNPAGRADRARTQMRDLGLPQDLGTATAVTRLRYDADRAEQTAARDREPAPARVVTRTIDAPGGYAAGGYDPADGRLELIEPETGRRVAYRDVPPALAARAQRENGLRTVAEKISGRPQYQYRDEQEATESGIASRCRACGRWADTSHVCPDGTASTEPRRVPLPSAPSSNNQTRFRPPTRLDRKEMTLSAFPSLTSLRDHLRDGPVIFPVHAQLLTPDLQIESDVTGEVVVARVTATEYKVDNSHLRCTCPAYVAHGDCEHLDRAVRSVTNQLVPVRAPRPGTAPDQPTPEQEKAARDRTDKALAQDWTRSVEHAQAARERFAAGRAPRYTDDFDAFEQAYTRALARRDAGTPAIPLMTGPAGTVTGGLGNRDGGRPFGVELEFDFPRGIDRPAALAAIGRDLAVAGLLRHPGQDAYHEVEKTGYSHQHQGGWSFEKDETVAGEIISPVMYDEPETWRSIALVCDTVKRHGGTVSSKTGSHVHVGAAEYDHTVDTHAELVRTVNTYEDVLHRISQNPTAVAHRPVRWCRPNPEVPPRGYRALDSYKTRTGKTKKGARDINTHALGLNMQAMHGTAADHVEMRHWDGSLDPAVIQVQIKTSLAVVDAAQRNAGKNIPKIPREPIGSHAARTAVPGKRSHKVPAPLAGDELRADSATFRRLADTLFSRAADKEQFAALYAVTRWQRRGR